VPAGKTIAAINRLVASRLKRNLGNAAALAAGCLEHFPLAAATGAAAAVRRATGFACRTAVRAAAGLIRKALHCEKFLFPGSERKLLSAVNAGKHFVCIHVASESPRLSKVVLRIRFASAIGTFADFEAWVTCPLYTIVGLASRNSDPGPPGAPAGQSEHTFRKSGLRASLGPGGGASLAPPG
jgi:hypothetical protein